MTKVKKILDNPELKVYSDKNVKIRVDVMDCSSMTINEKDLAVYFNKGDIDLLAVHQYNIRCMYHVNDTILIEIEDLSIDLRKLNKSEQREMAIAIANVFVNEVEVDPAATYREILLRKEIKRIDRKNAKLMNQKSKETGVKRKI